VCNHSRLVVPPSWCSASHVNRAARVRRWPPKPFPTNSGMNPPPRSRPRLPPLLSARSSRPPLLAPSQSMPSRPDATSLPPTAPRAATSSYPSFIPSSACKRSLAHLRRIPGGRCHPSACAAFPTGGDSGHDPFSHPVPGSSPAIEFPAPTGSTARSDSSTTAATATTPRLRSSR
jgi:hypothetical protein